MDSSLTAPAVAGNDLTTTRAPFIETAQSRGDLFIEQPYDLYSDRNHEAWRRLYQRMLPRWRRYANSKFLEGIDRLAIDPDQVPRLDDINRFLAPLTGFEAKAVSGYIPAFLFFDCLRRREFPTTITVRDLDSLDYLPEPDIFHDVAGHVPMHTDPAFADVLVRLGEVTHAAGIRAARFERDETGLRRLASITKAIARVFWFTVEFGLMREESRRDLKVYGSGLLSSFGEIQHSIESTAVQRYPFQLEWAINQCFAIDRYQPLLFVVDSFDHLFREIDQLLDWLRDGKLDFVAPGEPYIDRKELESFLDGIELG